MSDDLFDRYTTELTALTALASEFAKNHPGAAEQLRLPRPRDQDPHVERLLEGVAFLGARVRQRLDDEFPELTDTLLGVLYPHYLAPFPSCMMARLIPKSELQGPAVVKRGTLVRTEPVDGIACRFQTTAPVTLWPIEIETRSVRLTGLPLPSLLEGRQPKGAVGVLRLALRCIDPGMTFDRLGFDQVRLHLRGGDQVSHALYELLCHHVVAVAFAENARDERPLIRSASVMQPAGFAPDEAMLPWPAQGFSGFRLLAEYFAFPDKFMFVDIDGFAERRDARELRRIEMFFYLDHLPVQLERAVDETAFALGCVPLINLFPMRCEPIDMDWTRPEYRVEADSRRPETLEVWSVEQVSETRFDGSERPWRPFFRVAHADASTGRSGGSYLPRRRPSANGMLGDEVFLAVDDPSISVDRATRVRLSVDALCGNRDLPRSLPRGVIPAGETHAGALRLGLVPEEGSSVVADVVALSPPTETLRPPLRGERFWRLISHLSLSHLSIVGGVEGAAVLREVMRLYDLKDTAATRDVIAALTEVNAKPGTARLPGARAGSFCRGLDVRLTFEPRAWQSSGLYLLGTVLERFLALHGSVNGFVRCTAVLLGASDPVARWPARAGTRALL